MKITITTGTGEGPTPLAAFDTALLNAGVANYNLIYLSSIIPPNSVIKRECYVTPPDEYGHRLYLVMACQRAEEPGTSGHEVGQSLPFLYQYRWSMISTLWWN